jgi:predicted  nucleic acid-binding Zn-ribbon protein
VKLKDPDFKAVDRLISVTAGSPRIGDRKFRDSIQEKMSNLRKLDRAVICRIVYNVDVVPHAPPHILNFRHLGKLVYITKGGRNFIVNPNLSKHFSSWEEFKVVGKTVLAKKKQDVDKKAKEIAKATESFGKQAMARASMFVKEGTSSLTMTSTDVKANEANAIEKNIVCEDVKVDFAKECEESLEVIHDHMPYWYMTYLEKLKEEQDALYKTKEKIETVAEA